LRFEIDFKSFKKEEERGSTTEGRRNLKWFYTNDKGQWMDTVRGRRRTSSTISHRFSSLFYFVPSIPKISRGNE
jgi:hypothetical protein